MCFYVDTAKEIAEKSIMCYKILYKNKKGELFPPFFTSYQYKIGEHQRLITLTPIYEDGYLSVSDDLKYQYQTIHCGYHSLSYVDSDKMKYDKNLICYRALIPKGTEYYYNKEYGEYVSGDLIIVSEFK